MFALFAGEKYHPCGGWKDYCGSFDDLDAAIRHADIRIERGMNEWFHIVDLTKGAIVLDHTKRENA